MSRSLRCSVELNLHAVSAPGVWLPSKEDVYLSISILGQYMITPMKASVFPLFFHEQIKVNKTYYRANDPVDVMEYLEDELVVIELLQLSEYTDGAVRLASYCCCARDFLFPFPSLAPIYTSADRELLLDRTVAFPGISPKLEFSTKTVIMESVSAELDALQDATDMQRRRSSRRSRSPTRRPRSASNPRRMTGGLNDTLDTRPPFIVRKLSRDLIGRSPGGGPDAHGKSKGYKYKSSLSKSSDDLTLDWPSSRFDLYKDLSYKSYKVDDVDAEVSALTSRSPITSSYVRPRPRSASPVLTRPSFRTRYSDLPSYTHYPSYYTSYSDYLLQRRLEDYRLARLYDPVYSYYPYSSSYRHYLLEKELSDLELSTRLAKTRRYLY